MRPLGAGRWEIKAVIDDDCRQGLEQLKGLLSHVDPQMTLGQLLGRVVQEAVERHDPSRPPRRRSGSRAARAADESAATEQRTALPSATSAPKEAAGRAGAAGAQQPSLPAGAATSAAAVQAPDRRRGAAKPPEAAARTATSAPKTKCGRAIPAAVRRQVWERDRSCCSYVDQDSGRRCASRHLLQIDHVFPFALGGGAEPDNLRLLCAAHHRHRHRPEARSPGRR